MNKETKSISGGLAPTPDDPRDFSLGAIFGAIDISKVPFKNFIVAEPLKIKDQGSTDFCTAYALTAVSEDQEKVELNPEYQFAKSKQIQGDFKSWGCDLRSACKSAVKFGSLEQKMINDSVGIPDNPRDWNNWGDRLDEIARKHLKKSYFKVDSFGDDIFDTIRAALWQHRKDKRSIITGAYWKHAWTGVKSGVIGKSIFGPGGFGHAFKLFGQKIINKEPYIVGQLSNGEDIGDDGLFYFPREVVNYELKFGAYMFKDIPSPIVKHMIKNHLSVNDRLWLRIKMAFQRYYKYL